MAVCIVSVSSRTCVGIRAVSSRPLLGTWANIFATLPGRLPAHFALVYGLQGRIRHSIPVGICWRLGTLGATDLIDLSNMTRAEMSFKVRDSFDNPVLLHQLGGRQRAAVEGSRVEKIVVVKEYHASGEVHFHWAVKLWDKLRFP